MITRKKYLDKLISVKENGFPKVITGIRRCGKSYLLNNIYTNYLLESGISKDDIIYIDLTKLSNSYYMDPIYLYEYLLSLSKNNTNIKYVILDEVQEVYSIVNLALTDGKHIKAKSTDENIISFIDVILDLSSKKT